MSFGDAPFMLIDRSSLVVGENYNKYHRLNGDYHESSGFIFHSSILNFACARAFIFHSFYAWNVHSSNAFRAFMKMTQLYEIEVDLLGIIARCLYKAIYLNRTHKCGAAQCLEKVSERSNYYHFYFGGSFRNLKLEFTASFKKNTFAIHSTPAN